MQLDITCHHHLPTDTCLPVQSRGDCVKRKFQNVQAQLYMKSWIPHIGETHTKFVMVYNAKLHLFVEFWLQQIRNGSTLTKIHISMKNYISCLYLLHLTMTNVLIFISMKINYMTHKLLWKNCVQKFDAYVLLIIWYCYINVRCSIDVITPPHQRLPLNDKLDVKSNIICNSSNSTLVNLLFYLRELNADKSPFIQLTNATQKKLILPISVQVNVNLQDIRV